MLQKLADSLNLKLSMSINPVPTWYVDNISPNLQSPSNYAPLLVSIIIEEEFIQEKR